MLGHLLIIIVGSIRWALKGFRTDIKEEINGSREMSGLRSRNYIIGIAVVVILTLILIFT